MCLKAVDPIVPELGSAMLQRSQLVYGRSCTPRGVAGGLPATALLGRRALVNVEAPGFIILPIFSQRFHLRCSTCVVNVALRDPRVARGLLQEPASGFLQEADFHRGHCVLSDTLAGESRRQVSTFGSGRGAGPWASVFIQHQLNIPCRGETLPRGSVFTRHQPVETIPMENINRALHGVNYASVLAADLEHTDEPEVWLANGEDKDDFVPSLDQLKREWNDLSLAEQDDYTERFNHACLYSSCVPGGWYFYPLLMSREMAKDYVGD